MQYKLIKIILILVNIYSVSFARGGHGGGGHGGGHSHGSHASLARSSSTFGHNNRSLISSNRCSNTSTSQSTNTHPLIYYNEHSGINIFPGIAVIAILLLLWDSIVNDKIFTKIKKNFKKIRHKLIQNNKEYCVNFVIKFTDLQNIPSEYDTKEAYDIVGRNVLISDILTPLIVIKIQIINNFSLTEQYDLFYYQEIDKMDLLQLASNTVATSRVKQILQSSNEMSKFLENNKYIKIKFAPMISYLSGFHNKYLLGYGPINKNSENILRIYFNRQLIFQEILLKVFLNSNKEYNIIKENLLKQIEDYIDILTVIPNNKKQILMSAVVQNILDNKDFAKEFLNNINDNILLNLRNHVTFLIKNCNNQTKIKKYNKLLANLV